MLPGVDNFKFKFARVLCPGRMIFSDNMQFAILRINVLSEPPSNPQMYHLLSSAIYYFNTNRFRPPIKLFFLRKKTEVKY